MGKYDLSLVRARVNKALAKDEDDADVILNGSMVPQINWNDSNSHIVMPDWFKKISTIPGLPFGIIAEFVGLPNAGKTTAGIIALVRAQAQGFITILVDVEKKFPYKRFVDMGGSLPDLEVIDDISIEQNFNDLELFQEEIHEEFPDAKMVVLYDSVATGSTRADLAKTMLDPQVMADKAKVLKRAFQRQVVNCKLYNCCFISINQMYGDPNPAKHGAPSLSGGKGLEYAKSLSITFQKFAKLPPKIIDGEKLERGIITKMKTTKNHLQIGPLSYAEVLLHVTDIEMVLASASKKTKKNKHGQDVEVAIVESGEEVELDREDEQGS